METEIIISSTYKLGEKIEDLTTILDLAKEHKSVALKRGLFNQEYVIYPASVVQNFPLTMFRGGVYRIIKFRKNARGKGI